MVQTALVTTLGKYDLKKYNISQISFDINIVFWNATLKLELVEQTQVYTTFFK